MESENTFKPCYKCLDCMNYCRGGYEYYSDRECYVEEGCDINQVPNEECNRYMPTDEKRTSDYIEELEEMLLEIHRECKSNGGTIGENLINRLDEMVKNYYIKN